jgi:hypothetical protein
MDGCFASKFENRLDELMDNPDELTDYIVQCMPFLNQYSEDIRVVSERTHKKL